MPSVSQQRAIEALRPFAVDILGLHDEINSRIRARRREYVALDRHQRKTQVSAERRAHLATGLRLMLDGVDGWSLRREFLDRGRYEWDVAEDLSVRLAKRLPAVSQPPALTTTSMSLFDGDAVPRVERDRLLVRLLGDPLFGSATVDVACMVGRRQDWRITLSHIARTTTAPMPRPAARPEEVKRPVAAPKSKIRLAKPQAPRQREADGTK